MELKIYLDKNVLVILNNNFTYCGKVISCDKDSLTLLDKYNREVTLKENSIQLIKEHKI